MPAWFWADVIVVVHAAYVSVVVLTVPLVIFGWWRGWSWVQNSWYRHIHLAMIGIVVLESLLGWACPLTTWENNLRRAAGQEAFEGSFIGYWVHELLYFDLPPWAFTVLYCLFGLAVVALYVFIPPRCLQKRPQADAGE